MRYARRVDTNQAEIVQALRQIGAHVRDTSQVGDGFPDLVVSWRGVNILVEIKWLRPTSEGGRHGESEGQRIARETWPGPWIVVTSPMDAVEQLIKAVVMEAM